MRYYELPIPLFSNAGEPMQEAHGGFAVSLARVAGGYTAHEAYGSDGGPEELARVYRFAVSHRGKLDVILKLARFNFPDQRAFFVAHIGHGFISLVGDVPVYTLPTLNGVEGWEGGGPRGDVEVNPLDIVGTPRGFDNVYETGNPPRAALALSKGYRRTPLDVAALLVGENFEGTPFGLGAE